MAKDAGHYDTQQFDVVRDIMETALRAAEGGPGRALVVFDIDNTMMATDLDLGSEHWFLWQSELLRLNQGGGAADGLAAPSFDDLLRVQGWLYAITGMHPTDPALPATLKELAKRGLQTMALTSRSPFTRDATLREIARAGIDLKSQAPGPAGGFAGAFVFPGTERSVIYEDGVLFSDGQHKGTMLASLLAKAGGQFSAIVFVDDRPHHLDGVRTVFKDRPELVYTVRYDHERARKAAFAASDKAAAKAEWCRFAEGLTALTATGDKEPFLRCTVKQPTPAKAPRSK